MREWVWDLAQALPVGRPLDLLPGPLPPPEEASDGPFLSVLMRTQGTRPEPLSVALRSLADQLCRDFELLLLVHNPGREVAARMSEVVDSQPEWLRTRTRIETVVGGGVARPLNHGLMLASGRYVTILDDDDLALPHWVQTFAQLASRDPARSCGPGSWRATCASLSVRSSIRSISTFSSTSSEQTGHRVAGWRSRCRFCVSWTSRWTRALMSPRIGICCSGSLPSRAYPCRLRSRPTTSGGAAATTRPRGLNLSIGPQLSEESRTTRIDGRCFFHPGAFALSATREGSTKRSSLPSATRKGRTRRSSLPSATRKGRTRRSSLPSATRKGRTRRSSLPSATRKGRTRRSSLPSATRKGRTRRSSLPSATR